MFSSAKSSFFKALELSVAPVSFFKYPQPFKLIHNAVNSINSSKMVNIPAAVKTISLQDIKDYLKKEVKNGIIDKYSGLHPTLQLQNYYDDLIKQAQQQVALLDKCSDEAAMKVLFTDEKFLNMLDKYLELDIYQNKKPASWETIKAEISGYLAQNQVARQPGFRW